MTGAQLGPEFAGVAVAQRAGLISGDHARVITRAVADLPGPLRVSRGAVLEKTLVGNACTFDPMVLSSLARRAVALLDPDGVQPAAIEQHRKRGLSLHPRADGSISLTGVLTPACGAAFRAALDSLSAPQPGTDHAGSGDSDSDDDGDDDGLSAGGGDAVTGSGVGGGGDGRTAPQRRHDALEDLAHRLLADGGLPDTGGTSTTLLLTMTVTEFQARTGYAQTGHGDLIPTVQAIRLAADAGIIPIVFGDLGGVLAYGREQRLATPTQRRALAARDKGCSFPGCDRPPSWCQTHHEPDFQHGGQTNLDSMTLLCRYHHREHGRQGWTCHLKNGKPEWTPPHWIDPTQQPIHNTAHT